MRPRRPPVPLLRNTGQPQPEEHRPGRPVPGTPRRTLPPSGPEVNSPSTPKGTGGGATHQPTPPRPAAAPARAGVRTRPMSPAPSLAATRGTSAEPTPNKGISTDAPPHRTRGRLRPECTTSAVRMMNVRLVKSVLVAALSAPRPGGSRRRTATAARSLDSLAWWASRAPRPPAEAPQPSRCYRRPPPTPPAIPSPGDGSRRR